MPRGIPNSGKRGRKSAAEFSLSSLQEAHETHRQKLFAPVDRRIAQLTREIEQLQAFKASVSGHHSATTGQRRGRPPGSSNGSSDTAAMSSTPAAAPKTGRKGKRVRRSREDVQAHAQSILDFVKSSKGGVTGTQIKDKFGKIIGTVKNYVKQYTGEDLKSAGPKTSMRYTVG